MKTRAAQGGFTLVEIAIVLVIIGLLLGGILKGQELITSARVRNLADQASAVQAAYYGFVDRYHAIPGDMLKEPGLRGYWHRAGVDGVSHQWPWRRWRVGHRELLGGGGSLGASHGRPFPPRQLHGHRYDGADVHRDPQ
jgi:prepilin-type N-terminal cleavage/methylation domain-containing protein